MGNIGTLKLSSEFLTLCSSELRQQIRLFINEGQDIHFSINKQIEVMSITLKHPDFTEPDGTGYIFTATRDNSTNRAYLNKLCAYTPNGIKNIKTYENPYATV